MSNLPSTPTEARARFFAAYAAVVGGNSWRDVQRFLGINPIEPSTVDGWIEIGKCVRDRLAQTTAPIPNAPTPPALTHSFTLRVRIGSTEGPYTVTAATPATLAAEVAALMRAPGITIVEEAREWRTLPDGTPICPKHNVPMRLREKQGDQWYSHSVEGADGKPCYCKGYAGKDSPGWYVDLD